MDKLRRLVHGLPANLGPKRLIVGLAVVVLAGGGIAAGVSAASASGPTGFRTAEATMGSVQSMLDIAGTLEPTAQATADFQVAGTIASVSVSLGQTVTAGQALASLDPTNLDATMSSAQANLSTAQAKLTQDETGQASTVALFEPLAGTDGPPDALYEPLAGTDGPAGVDASLDSSLTSPSSEAEAVLIDATTPAPGTLQAAQQAVTSAQATADADLDTAAADFAAAQTACAASTTTSTVTPVSGTAVGSADSTACAAALQGAEDAQSQVATDQNALSGAESQLAQVLASAAAAAPAPSPAASPSPVSPSPVASTAATGQGAHSAASPSPSASSGAKTSGTSAKTATGVSSTSSTSKATSGKSSTGGGSATPAVATNSAQQLASDQAAIDTAQAAVVEAQQSLDDAQLTSPITGTVASVGLSVGQGVNADSATEAITVINTGSYQTVSSLTSSQVATVAIGDTAQVTVDGAASTMAGTVSRVGPVDDTTSGITYPLVVALTAGSPGVPAGSAAQVQVEVAHAANTLVVPTSAVHLAASGAAVMVLESGVETPKPVTVEVVGGVDTQITSGLTKGTQVVLADLSEAVPSSSTNTTTRTFGGAGGAGGFTGGAGGFTGRFGGGGGGAGGGSGAFNVSG